MVLIPSIADFLLHIFRRKGAKIVPEGIRSEPENTKTRRIRLHRVPVLLSMLRSVSVSQGSPAHGANVERASQENVTHPKYAVRILWSSRGWVNKETLTRPEEVNQGFSGTCLWLVFHRQVRV
jgi:hypothetical protein